MIDIFCFCIIIVCNYIFVYSFIKEIMLNATAKKAKHSITEIYFAAVQKDGMTLCL